MQHADSDPIETIRVSDRDKRSLVDAVDESSLRTVEEDRRALRVRYNETSAVLTIFNESGNDSKLAVVPRNLSRRGMAFVHGRFVYPDSTCEVMIKALDGKWHVLAGVIRNCRHVSGIVHEVSVVFDEPIDLSMFSALSPEEEMLHLQELSDDEPDENAGVVNRLVGTVLIVDSFPTDRKLFCLWMARAGFEAVAAMDAESARDAVERHNFDLVLIDMRLPNESGASLIRSLRTSGFVSPILAVSADESEDLKEGALKAGANVFMTKPFTTSQLLDQSQTLVGVDLKNEEDEKPIYSSVKDDDDMKLLLTEFIHGLSTYMGKLRDANTNNDYESIESLSQVLKGTGSGYGLEVITQHATEVLGALHEDAVDIEKIKHTVNDLVRILNRVKLH